MDTFVPLLVLAAAALYFFKKGVRPVLIDKTILLFCLSQVLLNTFSEYLYSRHISNLWVYSVNILVFVFVFTSYFYIQLAGRFIKRYVIGGLVIFSLFFCFNIVYIQPLNTFNSYSYALGALLIVVYSLTGLRQLLNYSHEYDILRLKNFWFAAGILLYFGSSFFIFISYHYLSETSANDVGVLWKIHNLFLAVGCFVFLKAIMCKEWIPK
jgi:hypothetical protein